MNGMQHPESPGWECRRCRLLIAHAEKRFSRCLECQGRLSPVWIKPTSSGEAVRPRHCCHRCGSNALMPHHNLCADCTQDMVDGME